MTQLTVEIGWPASASTGWGLIALHVALGLTKQGHRVILPRESDLSGVSPVLRPTLAPMLDPGDPTEHRIRLDAWGNHWPTFQAIPNRTRVLFAVFEDTAIPQRAIDDLAKYDLVLTPSTWAHDILAARGVGSTVWHQGYDDALFYPAPRKRPAGPLYVFSGGKLEFRKGQDIVVEAFKRFRATPEGKDAVLVTAWQNRWPQTMQGIWESGYVRGVPSIRNGLLDIPAWLEANGVPREAVIDLGFPTQAELAQAIRECDVALFPNRCEGATNMVLPEVLACGVPAIVSQNCGHRDVMAHYHLMTQPPVTLPCALFGGMDGWGESDPEEACAALVAVARDPDCRSDGEFICGNARWDFAWSVQVLELRSLLSEIPAHA